MTRYVIPTGSQSLEALVGGAIDSLQFTEAFGEFRSGKTQLLPNNMKRGNGNVAIIDRDGTS
ncbi:Meiotic recombination protein dmc1 [Orobanche hederae]